MLSLGLFVFPVLAWIGIAATIRTLRPPKATTVQIVCLLTSSFAFLASCVALAIAFKSSLSSLLGGLAESVALCGLVCLQFWKLKISEGQNRDSPEQLMELARHSELHLWCHIVAVSHRSLRYGVWLWRR
jgi:hypothetical protein